ncbi:nuclear transport factor 2 family protein [Flavobacterium sp. MDT1-60]|uniref:YybH family protein n=1 Tax=Flavobacterium sp. MDT1-60 TaxID=1979344 RepID=UPI00177AD8E5|nr:nuclear transport factor 2 family protein [Flavobacterium sp. MDT1-60]QOG00666.1 nuclear transport factor 2 family protein [Flavobacterium sp. MDT1-60]
MKNKILNGLLLGSVLISMFACNQKKEEEKPVVVDKEQIKKEIQAKEDEFAATYNSGELKNIGYYADDAVSYYQHRKPLVGKQAISEFLIADLGANSNLISFKTNEVFVSNDGNQVVESGSFTVTDSSKTVLNSGNYLSLFEKRDGKYVCVRDMSASDVEAK